MNMRRGELGAIIAKIRISRQIHEMRMMSSPLGGTAHALNAAIAAPWISIIVMPALLFSSSVVLDRRRCQYMTADPATPHICRLIARQFRTQPFHTHGMTNESSVSAKDHSTSATVLNTTSRCACSDSNSVGRRLVPESPTEEAGVSCGAILRDS